MLSATCESIYILSSGSVLMILSTWAGQTFDTASGSPEGTVTEPYLSGNVINVEANSVHLICFK